MTYAALLVFYPTKKRRIQNTVPLFRISRQEYWGYSKPQSEFDSQPNKPSIVCGIGRCLLDEECACDERAVRKQCSGRKMSVLDLARRSARTHLPVFAHSPFKYHHPAPVDDDHLERWAALPRFVWPDETHHFVSQSTGDVPVAHGPCRFLPLVLDSCA